MLSIFSPPFNDFRLLPKLSSSDNLSREDINLVPCLTEDTAALIYVSYYITNIFFLFPLCILVLHHGFQQYQKNGSTFSATLSHSDSFTYYLVTMEIIGIFGCTLCLCGLYSGQFDILLAGHYFFSFTTYGENFFHTLTCVERYLAVMYPVVYRSLKNERGIRVRNISVGCVWLMCFVFAILLINNIFALVNLFVLLLSLIVISFCSLCVLSALIRPGPGQQGGGRVRVDHSKQKAFYTILTILGTLILRFGWGLSWAVLYALGESFNCVLMAFVVWFHVPSSLVLPLLFLHRKRKI